MNERPTSIKGMDRIRYVPRAGYIRLGEKVRMDEKHAACVKENKHPATEVCMYCTRPKDLDYFRVPPEVEAVYGPTPRELDVILTSEDPNKVFPYALKWFKATERICHGNGVFAWRAKKHMQEDRPPLEDCGRTFKIQCPCSHLKDSIENPKGECSAKGSLFVMLPRITIGRVYQINTGSFYGITGIRSCIDYENREEGIDNGYLRSLFGRIALIPMKLRRVETDVARPDGKRVKKWILQLSVDKSVDALTAQAYRDGAVLAIERTKHLCLPPADRDIRDVETPIDVVDAEYEDHKDTTQAEDAATLSTTGSPPSEGAAVAADGERISAPHEEAPPAREPGDEDNGEWLEDPLDEIKESLRAAKTLQELDATWTTKVMKNKELDGKLKFELQEVLLEQKKRLKKSK